MLKLIKLIFSSEFFLKTIRFFAELIRASKIVQIGVSASIVIVALSFGGSLFVQAKSGCFKNITSTIFNEIAKSVNGENQ